MDANAIVDGLIEDDMFTELGAFIKDKCTMNSAVDVQEGKKLILRLVRFSNLAWRLVSYPKRQYTLAALVIGSHNRRWILEHLNYSTSIQVREGRSRMEDNKRGFSLRQKKPSAKHPPISAPRQISNQSNSAALGSTNNATRTYGGPEKTYNPNKQRSGMHGGNTSDLVKRRYSTRFAQLPDFNKADAPPVPNGASFANLKTKQDYLVAAPARSINVDVAAFKDPKLGIEKCESRSYA